MLTHIGGSITGNTETFNQGVKNALIFKPFRWVDIYCVSYFLGILLCFVCIFSEGNRNQVHAFDILIRFTYPPGYHMGDSLRSNISQADFCGEVHIGFAEYRIACRKACIALEQSLDSCRERREASRHLFHLRSQRGNGSSNSIALFGKRVKVGLSQRLRYGVNLRSEFHELVQPVCERTKARLLDALQGFECVHQSLYLLPCKGQPCQARNALTELLERVRQCAKANAALAYGSGCGFQPSKRLGKCVYAANGRCRIRLYFKLQLLDCRRHNAHFPSNFLLWLAMNPSIMRLPLSYTPLACSSSLSSTCFSVSA